MLSSPRHFSARVLRSIARRIDAPTPPGTYPPTPITELEKLFSCLHLVGFKPNHVVDIGANLGNWTRTCQRYFPTAYYTLLEPQIGLKEKMADLLTNPRVTLHSVGAGPINGALDFTVHERHDSSSFVYSADEAARRGFKQIRVPVVRLDTLLAQLDRPPPDMIKIDAEGFDLEVIKGGRTAISKAEVVLLEAGVTAKGAACSILDVVNELNDLGYCPFDITDLNRTEKSGALWLIEIAFVQKGGSLDRCIVSYSN